MEGHTRPSVFLRELNLPPGTSYDQTQAQHGLDRILQLEIVHDADIQLEPIANSEQVMLVIRVRERRDDPVNPTEGTRFRFGVDQAIPMRDANWQRSGGVHHWRSALTNYPLP